MRQEVKTSAKSMTIVEMLERIELLEDCYARASNNGLGWIHPSTQEYAAKECATIDSEVKSLYEAIREAYGKERSSLNEVQRMKVDFIIRYMIRD